MAGMLLMPWSGQGERAWLHSTVPSLVDTTALHRLVIAQLEHVLMPLLDVQFFKVKEYWTI